MTCYQCASPTCIGECQESKSVIKICKNCKYYKPSLWCVSPSNGVSLVDGEAKSRVALLNRKESDSIIPNRCGPDGVHYEPIEVKLSVHKNWWKFWSN